MRRLNFLRDDPWDEVNDDITVSAGSGHPFEERTSSGRR